MNTIFQSLKTKFQSAPRLVYSQQKHFSGRSIKPPQFNGGGSGLGTYALLGAGTAGLAYLMLKGRAMSAARYQASPMQTRTYFDPIVQARIRQTLGYFAGGLGATGVAVASMRHMAFPYKHPFMLMFGSIAMMLGTMFTSYHQQPALKHLLYGGFIGTMALSMIPLINMASMPIIYDALFATGITVGGLGAVAYNAPSE